MVKICKECGKEVPRLFSKGRCFYCASKSYKGLGRGKKKSNKELVGFFKEKIDEATHSDKSGQLIYTPTGANIAHILPKTNHKSVATHPQNFIVLTVDEHARFDKLLLEFRFEELKIEFKECWNKILNNLKYVLPACKENTKLKRELEKFIA